MCPIKEDKSWVLSAAMVIIPVLLIVLAMWLWPVMRQVYSLPDSAVPTYRQALKNIVPPGVGRLTRTDVIERALAGVLGELSDAAQTADSAEMPQLLKVLKLNSAMGRWAAAVMTLPRSGRLSLFNWGIRPENLPVVNKAFSRWSLDRIAAVDMLAKIPGPQSDAILTLLLRDPVAIVHLSVMSVLFNRRPIGSEIAILRHWAHDPHPYGYAEHREWKMFLFGRLAVNARPVLYRMNRQTNLTYARQFSSVLLTRWKAPVIASSAPAHGPMQAAGVPVSRSIPGGTKAVPMALQSEMKAVSGAVASLAHHDTGASNVNRILAAEYRTLIGATVSMRWQEQLEKIMRFNAAMARWIYLVAQRPPATSRAMFNWIRFRAQNVELMRMVMSRQRSQRLRTVSIAPKLHGVEQLWFIHRLLMDQRVSVELAMLHALWKMPKSSRLMNLLNHWVNVEPLPKGHNGHGLKVIEFNGRAYVIDRTVGVQRYRQARRIGRLLLERWQKGIVTVP